MIDEISLFASFIQLKTETRYQRSKFSGLCLYPSIVLSIAFDRSTVNIGTVLITLILTAILKSHNKLIYFLRVLLLFPELLLQNQNHALISSFLINQIYVPYWPSQIVFQMILVRSVNGLYLGFGLLMLSRYFEILKRRFFISFYIQEYDQHQKEYVLEKLPIDIFLINSEANILYSNHNVKQFDNELQRKLSNAIRKKKTNEITINNKYYKLEQYHSDYILTQSQFSCGDVELFIKLSQQIDQLYNLICQDYQKWNNLRAFKVVKESDLSILGQCTTDCRLLKQQIDTINILNHDCQQIKYQSSQKDEFFLKNYVVNVIESMVNRLQEHFNLIQLEFEEGIPEKLVGNKHGILFSLYAFLMSAMLVEQKSDNLTINVRIAQVYLDKSEYDLEISICFPCSNKQMKLYCQDEFENENEKFLLIMINQCKQLLSIDYKTDGDNIIILLITNVQLCKKSDKSCDNIQMVDLTFTKNVIDVNHYFWNAKRFASPTMTYDKSLRSPLQKCTAKFNYAADSLASTIKLQSIPNSAQASAANSNAQSLENTLIKNEDIIKEVENAFKYTIQFPQIQDDIMKLLEQTLQAAYNEGILDHDKTILDIGYNHIHYDKYSQISVRSDTPFVQDYGDQLIDQNDNEFQKSKSKQFKTPQLKPRDLIRIDNLGQQLIHEQNKKQEQVNRSIQGKRNKDQKQLNVLFSPSVMSKFSNNLVSKVQKSKTQLPNIDDNNDIKFHIRVRDHRLRKQQRKWSCRIRLDELPKQQPNILCLIPNTQFIQVAQRFGNSLYGDQMIGEPIITYSVSELIKIYKQHFNEGKQFCFILIYIHKISEIEELSIALQSNENQWSQDPDFKKTVMIGVYNQTQLNKNLYQFLKYTIPLSQDAEQLAKSKEWIAEISK
ncbi:unnamed protein product [Paramecium primaurelia]|uniref:Uncharacterized protein n=1 Tax=Paramecium primaurelia TaxID=5886 RepID=A0A8S1NE18_PARPR|nr:unnamed protein product [Paramecium primaurelia]